MRAEGVENTVVEMGQWLLEDVIDESMRAEAEGATDIKCYIAGLSREGERQGLK